AIQRSGSAGCDSNRVRAGPYQTCTRDRVAKLRERYESLTPREREVMPLVVFGLLNKQIAAEIGASEATVKVHRSQLMRKMGAESVADLVRMAAEMGIPAAKPKGP